MPSDAPQWAELAGVLAAFVGSAFALLRMALAQQRAMAERFIGFLEQSLRRQEDAVEGFRRVLGALSVSVGENTETIRRLAERLNVTFDTEAERSA